MKRTRRIGVLFWIAAVGCPAAEANISIVPTFDASITSQPNAAEIEDGIDQAIAGIESVITTPITVSLEFTSLSTGLGGSDTPTGDLSYSQYLIDLANNRNASADDLTALAHLPAGPGNPVNGNLDVSLALANLRAIGESALGDNGGEFDGTVSLNFSVMNLSRVGPQDPGKYDLLAVATHEIDEALGIGGNGSILPAKTGPVGAMDLFRFGAPGVRSFTTFGSATAYFSIDGGATRLTGFNQAGEDSDYGDWAGGPTPQVQDAFGTPGVDVNLGLNEMTALDVVGYDLAPEPGSGVLSLGTLVALGIERRRRQSWASR